MAPGAEMQSRDQIVEFLITELTANLGASLTTIEADYNDGITLGTPTYWRAEQGHYPGDFNIVIFVETKGIDDSPPLPRIYGGRASIVSFLNQSHATFEPAEVLNKRVWRQAVSLQDALENKRFSSVDRIFVSEMNFISSLDGDELSGQQIDVGLDIHTYHA
jgi:hypothetical protein